jgi:hypothetical protein
MEDNRKDYSILGTVEKSLLYFVYYIYNSLYNYSPIYRSYFKYIGIIAIVLIKGLLGILSLFYNNSKGAKNRMESK